MRWKRAFRAESFVPEIPIFGPAHQSQLHFSRFLYATAFTQQSAAKPCKLDSRELLSP